MYKLKLRHLIFLLILESSIVNTTESSSSSKTLLYILDAVLLALFCFVSAMILFIFRYLTKRLRTIFTLPSYLYYVNKSTETFPLVPITTIAKLVRRIPKQTLIRAGEQNPFISGMSYNSERDELFLADYNNKVVRAMRVRDTAGDLRDVYRAPHDTDPLVLSVCHMSDSDTLLVCSREKGPDEKRVNWLVALSRNGSEWREAQRVQTENIGRISCALSDSRVLIGDWSSTYMELFRVESGPRIARVHRIHVTEEYYWFSATCGSDTLVAMSYPSRLYSSSLGLVEPSPICWDNSVRVHRLRGDRLEELARIQLKLPSFILWLADRLLVADGDSEKQSDAVIELEMSDMRLERRRELIATSEKICVYSWCAVNDKLVIFDYKFKDILHISLLRN